jgi:hypothetical protein
MQDLKWADQCAKVNTKNKDILLLIHGENITLLSYFDQVLNFQLAPPF